MKVTEQLNPSERSVQPEQNSLFSLIREFLQKRTVRIITDNHRLFSEKDMSIFSGNATFYILMAMVPFFSLAAGLINFLPEEYLYSFADLIQSLFPDIEQIQDMLKDLLSHFNPATGTVVISISLLSMLWSASQGVSALQLGLRRLCSSNQSKLKLRIASLFCTVLFILVIASLLIFRVLRSSISDFGREIARLLNRPEISDLLNSILNDGGLITLAATLVIVMLAYTFLQGHTRSFRSQLPGAVFTVINWHLFSLLFELFIAKSCSASALYGSLASIFLTAMWLKTIITILFYGASLNEVLAMQAENGTESSPNAS